MTWLTGRDVPIVVAVVRLIAPAVIGALIALGLVDADAVCGHRDVPSASSYRSPVALPELPPRARLSE